MLDAYALVCLLRLAIDMVLRAFYSGVYAYGRVHRPAWSAPVAPTLLIGVTLALWSWLGGWSFVAALLTDMRERVRRTAALLPDAPAPDRTRALIDVANQALSTRSPLATPYAPLLADLVSDRHQLRQVDWLLALWIAEAVTHRRGVRALRDLPYRRLRELGLRSLVVGRNG